MPQPDHDKPSTPSAEELAAIKAAFDELYSGLFKAKQLFESGRNGGREGAIHAVESVLKFIEKSTVVQSQGYHAPLARLFDDLLSLDDGKVSELLKPRSRSGRAVAGGFYDALRGVAVFTVRRLEATGMAVADARKMVSNKLNGLNVRPARKGSKDGGGKITARTLRGWQEGIAADVGFHSTAAQTLRDLEAENLTEALQIAGLSSLPSGATPETILLDQFPTADIRRCFLDRLASYIETTRSAETT